MLDLIKHVLVSLTANQERPMNMFFLSRIAFFTMETEINNHLSKYIATCMVVFVDIKRLNLRSVRKIVPICFQAIFHCFILYHWSSASLNGYLEHFISCVNSILFDSYSLFINTMAFVYKYITFRYFACEFCFRNRLRSDCLFT